MEPMSPERVIEQNLDRIKQELGPIPKSGHFEKRSIEFPCEVGRYSAIVQLILRPTSKLPPQHALPDWEKRRNLEIKVCDSKRSNDCNTHIYSGTKDEMEAFLNDTENAVQRIYESIKDGVVELKRDEDEEWGKRHYPAP